MGGCHLITMARLFIRPSLPSPVSICLFPSAAVLWRWLECLLATDLPRQEPNKPARLHEWAVRRSILSRPYSLHSAFVYNNWSSNPTPRMLRVKLPVFPLFTVHCPRRITDVAAYPSIHPAQHALPTGRPTAHTHTYARYIPHHLAPPSLVTHAIVTSQFNYPAHYYDRLHRPPLGLGTCYSQYIILHRFIQVSVLIARSLYHYLPLCTHSKCPVIARGAAPPIPTAMRVPRAPW